MTQGAAREELLRGQRDWLRERDRRCIADRSFKELAAPSGELAKQAYDCLNVLYLGRRQVLQDRVAKPLAPENTAQLDLTAIAKERPELLEKSQPRIASMEASPDGSVLAAFLPSLELDLPDQVWLYRVADGKWLAATPTPDQQATHPDNSPAALNAWAWKGDTLYVRLAVWSASNAGEQMKTVVYAATPDASRRLDEPPRDIVDRLDAASQMSTIEPGELPESDQDALDNMKSNRDFLVWSHDLGHGTIELRMRKRASEAATYTVAWGSWLLWRYLFDAQRSQLIYSADTGITVFHMATRAERRIAGTSAGDQPQAVSADRRLFIWSTRNQCGDELLVEQDMDAPERYCIASLNGRR